MSELGDAILGREWFYRFTLPDGRQTAPYIPDDVVTLHEGRLSMLDSFLAKHDGCVRALDIACHEGYFTKCLAERGAEVVGIDAREDNLAGAQLIRDVYGLKNVTFLQRDIFDVGPDELGTFDVVVMFGLLYHVENPIGLLRIARSLTERVCLVETQVAPNLSGVIDWGSYRYPVNVSGSFALVDEQENHEAGIVNLALCPSLPALLAVMRAVGFSKVEVLDPPVGVNDQLSSAKRVMVAGFVEC